VFVVLTRFPPYRENWEDISIDQIRFSQAPRNVHAIGLLIVHFEPFLDISKTGQGIVSQAVI
jgi:hypothetical protein